MPDQLLECQRDLLRLQRGVITRQQAREGGLTDKAIAVRLEGGRWQRLYPGVYATFSGDPPRRAVLWAAVLRAGPQAVLSHETAAELHGLLDVPAPLIHVTVPSGSPVTRPPGVAVHYSGRLELSRHPALEPPRTRLEDTVLDLAGAAAALDDSIGVILRAVGRRMTTPERLSAAMARRARMRWRQQLGQALGGAAEGALSLLEYQYLTRVERAHGLPCGTRQHPVWRAGRRQYQDVTYDGYALIVELDGDVAHPAEYRWLDVRRDNLNAAHGQATIRFGFPDVFEQPCVSAGIVGSSLTVRGWAGVPRRCGAACQLPGPHFALPA